MYIAPELIFGTVLGFIILLFGHLFAMYLLERTHPDKEFDLEFCFPLKFPFKIVSKEKESTEKEATEKEATESEKDIEFVESYFKYKSIDLGLDADKIRRDTELIIERLKEKYDENTTQE